MARDPTDPRPLWWGALAGLLAALAALAAAELAAVRVRPEAAPAIAVGRAVIAATPHAVEQAAVQGLGHHDKPVLIGGVLVLLAVLAAASGAVAVRHRGVGLAGVALLGLVGAVAAATRPGAGVEDPFPSLVGAVVGAMALIVLLRPLRVAARDAAVGPGATRRALLVTSLWVAAGSVAVGTVGRLLNSRTSRTTASRAAVRLPAPADPAPPLPAGAELHVPGLSSFVTPDTTFYRVDTALVLPRLAAETWRLRVHGMVDRELEVDFAGLLARGLVERDVTLTCVSNEVGGGLAGNARWLGALLAPLLAEAGVHPDADLLLSTADDGMTIGTPTAVVRDGRDAMLAVGMNGEPLPVAHGFPVRMVVPGLYGYVSATKWVVDLELTRFDRATPYWVGEGWAARGPIRTASRIDTPRGGAVAAGRVAVAGVAWAQHRGISRVEVRVDDGAWSTARLGDVPGPDTWRQWVWEWDATPGEHALQVRATDASGATQTSRRADPYPSGATGWHTVRVRVA